MVHGEEIDAFGDSAYKGVDKCPERRGSKARRHVALKRQRRNALPNAVDGLDLANCQRIKAKIRAPLEHPFHVLKNLFGYRKVRYEGAGKQ